MKSFLVLLSLLASAAAEPLLKPGDVVALVGGEEMVAAAEAGHLEFQLMRCLPEQKLRFRSLAWEGDTVFEQPRDLNYPTLELQLAEVGATAVIAQFGAMESLAGRDKVGEFTAAYEKLIERLRGEAKRRVILLGPAPAAPGSAGVARFHALEGYTAAIRGLGQRLGLQVIIPDDAADFAPAAYRDPVHLNDTGQQALAARVAQALAGTKPAGPTSTSELNLADSIQAKNRLWFHYARPQNWAFLNGDRTVQPSSRDHLDPSKRWFPEEMKQWLTLIADKEKEIWSLAQQGPR